MPMLIREILAVSVYIIMLPVLAAVLFIAFMHKRGFMERAGFGKPEVGMILVGSMFGIFADIPIIVSRQALLNINLGGALIPVIISGALIYKKKMGPLRLMFGIAVVSIVSYMISRFEPGIGIIAEFPYYLLPSFGAIILSLVLFSGYDKRISYAYSTAVLGTLIGADLVRIPLLIDEGVLGSMGGAGVMDLVYLSGLIAAVPLVLFYYWRFPLDTAKDPMVEANRLFKQGRWNEALEGSVNAVERELASVGTLIKRITGARDQEEYSSGQILYFLGFHPYVVRDYLKLKDDDPRKNPHRSLHTAKLLRRSIRVKISKRFTRTLLRVFAYLVDLFITTVPLVLMLFYVSINFDTPTQASISPYLLALIVLIVSIQFIYFTILEWYFGTSIGKKIFGLEVVSDDYGDITFVQSAARNSGRYADMALLFYLVSLVLITSGTENKRIGDHIAGTRVVKVK